jgi:hypothetical protein
MLEELLGHVPIVLGLHFRVFFDYRDPRLQV